MHLTKCPRTLPSHLDVTIVYIVPKAFHLGEFEQYVLLATLQLGTQAYALPMRNRLTRTLGRRVARGALYRTLDRLDEKGYVDWEVERDAPSRGGHPRRLFRVTPAGVAALRASRRALIDLWGGLEGVLD